MANALALNVGAALAVAVLGFSLILAAVSGLSWVRLRNPKLAVVGAAFLVLAVKGGIATWRVVESRSVDLAVVSLDFAVLAFLYASVALR